MKTVLQAVRQYVQKSVYYYYYYYYYYHNYESWRYRQRI